MSRASRIARSAAVRVAIAAVLALQGCGLVAAREASPGSGAPRTAVPPTDAADAPNIVGRDWIFSWVEGYDGPLPGPTPEPGFILTLEGQRMSGSTACNRMMASFALDERSGALSFRGLVNNRMLCNRAASGTEQAVLTAMIATDAYRCDGSTLELLSKGRVVARLFWRGPMRR